MIHRDLKPANVELTPEGKVKVLGTAGGMHPRWSPDGTELFYRMGETLYSAAIDDADGIFKSRRPVVVLDDLETLTSDYDVLDAQRFLVVERVGADSEPTGVTVVVNWRDELLRLVPRH